MNTSSIALVAALAIAAPFAAHADRTASPAPAETAAIDPGALTRQQVKDELSNWKAAGLMQQPGEVADTREVLDARQTFAELQTEVLTAEYEAAERVMQALAAQPYEDTADSAYGN